jgi:lipid-A-disaccharide synthase
MALERSPRLAMVAGEASGDLLGGLLLAGLRTHWPDLSAAGIGGPHMTAQGFEAWWPHHLLSVMGYAEALSRIVQLLRLRRELGDRVLAEQPDLFIGVDAPDFNFGLEARLKRQGLRTVHFVSPSIWAWRGERVHKIARACDHVLCLFPFEPALYHQYGVAATYVGHPLADAIPLDVPRAASREALGLAPTDVVVALLPGSRRSEIRHIGPRLVAAAQRLKAKRRNLKFVMPVVPGLRGLIDPMVNRADGLIQLLDGRAQQALAACDVAIVASGTATLEAALFKRPMVITYVMNELNWQLMKRRSYLPWIGLPNILLRDFAVPELLQRDARPERLADAALAWLDNPARCEVLRTRFDALHRQLRCDTARTATDAIEKILAS